MFDSLVHAGVEHQFAGFGVDRFRIAGIETSAGLDPNDMTAFVTGLTFVGSDVVSMRMEPVTTLVNAATVPEPTILALIGLGLAGLSYSRRGRL